MTYPIFYSFRRCPYAMRARLALVSSGVKVELREILLRDKAPEFLETSPSATVPCLKLQDQVLDESLDIMKWSLAKSDPSGWLNMPKEGDDLIALADGPFKDALDRTKYHTRYGSDPVEERDNANVFLREMEDRLTGNAWLFGERPTLADMAILPFVRQFANIDRALFDAHCGAHLTNWLDNFLGSTIFAQIMHKYAVWQKDDGAIIFPS